MNLYTLAWREFRHRKAQLLSGLVAISLGIAVIVAVRSIAVASERAVALRLDNLGANTLVLPEGSSVDDYYTADIDAPTMPEEYVERVLTSALPGVDNVSPKLTRRIRIDGKPIVLTGILPSSEIASKPIWQSAGLVGDDLALSCDPDSAANKSHGLEDERLQRKAVDSLARDECFVGSDVSARMGWREGAQVSIEGASFRVSKILPSCGTVDDDRVFVHLERAQEMFQAAGRISVIEIMGCCNAISEGLLAKLRNILPDTRVTSIHQIVSTQVETNRMMNKVSIGFLVIVFVVGGLSIGNFMWANVNQRRREIGTLVMVGAPRAGLYRLFLSKAVGLGVVGGLLGYALGTLGGVVAGPWFAGLDVRALPIFLLWSVLLSVGVALVGSLLPAWLAARMEPFSNMQEV